MPVDRKEFLFTSCSKERSAIISRMPVEADYDADDGPSNPSAVAGAEDEEYYTDRFKYQTPRRGQLYHETQYIFKRDWERRRDDGAGRPRKAASVRESLRMWYNMIRHSVDVKLMVRFPKTVLLVKAHELYRQYLKACIYHSLPIEYVEITGSWLNQIHMEYRISHLQPNRKYKVARWVLSERLEIYRLSVAKVRKLILLHFCNN